MTIATPIPASPSDSPNAEESQYLRLIHQILTHGTPRSDRTGTGTLSIFAPPQLYFSLADQTFPLLTTKRVFFRGVVEELLWMLRGDTSSTTLSARNVTIWDKNGSREELDKRGWTDREVGDLGPVYGFQWRHFGAEYKGPEVDYTGMGKDQIMEVVRKIKDTPHDRRIVLCAWNPADVDQMVLPPCHMFCQFYVQNNQTLDCLMYQRSADIGLGVPFNIASYALLTIIIAHLTNLQPGRFIHTFGDAHIYNDHIEPLKKQLENEPRAFPKLYVRPERDIMDPAELKAEDFVLEGYTPHKKIQMEMSV